MKGGCMGIGKKTKAAALCAAVGGVYLFAVCPALRHHPDTEEMKNYLYAHRGLYDNAGFCPENSLPAFQRAIDQGYGIELDIQLTKDEEVVVFHDLTVGRVLHESDGSVPDGNVADYTYDQLKEMHLKESEERVPLLSDVLELVDGRVPLIVELKVENSDFSGRLCEKAQELLDEYAGMYCVESFHPGVVLWYRLHRPSIMRGQLSKHYELRSSGLQAPVLFASQALLFNWLTKPDFIAYSVKNEKDLSRQVCRHLFRNTSVAWTVKTKNQMESMQKRYDLMIFDHFDPNEISQS